MKRILGVVLTLFCLGCLAENLIENGDFSKADENSFPVKWLKERAIRKDYMKKEMKVFVSAPGSLLLRSGSYVYQDVKLVPDTNYTFSCWYKGDHVLLQDGRDPKWGGGIDITLCAVLPDGKTKWLAGVARKFIGTTDWTRFEWKFNSSKVPGGTLRVRLSLEGCNWNSAAYVDDVVLEPETVPSTVTFYPVEFQQNQYFLCENMPGILRLEFTGDPDKLSADGVTLVMELPEKVRLLGTSCMRPDPKSPEYFHATDAKEIPGAGVPGTRRFEASVHPFLLGLLKKNSYNWDNALYFYLAAEPGSTGVHGSTKLELKSKDAILYSSRFNLNVIAPIVPPPHRVGMLQTVIFRTISQCNPFPEVRRDYLKFWLSLSDEVTTQMTYIDFFKAQNPELYEKFRFFWHDFGTSVGNVPNLTLYKLRGSEKWKNLPKLMDASGKENPDQLATWYSAEDTEHLIWNTQAGFIEKSLKQYPGKIVGVVDNFEPIVDTSYDRGNLERFARYAKLPAVPTREEARGKYKKQWLAYRIHQNAAYSRNYAAMIHKNFPGLLYVPCNMPLLPDREIESTDYRLYDDVIDLNLHMFYWTGAYFFDMVEFNLKSTRKPSVILTNPSQEMLLYQLRYTPEEFERDIVVTAALGAAGIGFYPSDAFDGRYLQAISSGYSTVAKLEKFYSNRKTPFPFTLTPENVGTYRFRDGEKTAEIMVPDTRKFIRTTSHRAADGSALLSIFNFSPTHSLIYEFKSPQFGHGFSVDDLASNIHYSEADSVRGMLISVPAGGNVFLRLSPKRVSEEGFRKVTQAQMRTQLDSELVRLKASDQFQSSRQGTSEISYSFLPNSSGNPLLKLQNAQRSIYIDFMNGADAVGWTSVADKNNDWLAAGKSRGFLGRLCYYDKTQDRLPPYPFIMKKTGYEAGAPFAEFEYEVPQYRDVGIVANPLLGLVCTKRFTLEKGGKRLTIRLDFENRNPYKKAVTLGFRINNAPMPGGRFAAGATELPDLTKILYRSPKDSAFLGPERPSDFRLLNPSVKIPPFATSSASAPWLPSELVLEAESGPFKEQMVVTFVPAPAGYFFWHGAKLYTVEPMSEEIRLEPGEKKTYVLTFEVPDGK